MCNFKQVRVEPYTFSSRVLPFLRKNFDLDLHFKKDLFYELKKTRPLHTIINRIFSHFI